MFALTEVGMHMKSRGAAGERNHALDPVNSAVES